MQEVYRSRPSELLRHRAIATASALPPPFRQLLERCHIVYFAGPITLQPEFSHNRGMHLGAPWTEVLGAYEQGHLFLRTDRAEAPVEDIILEEASHAISDLGGRLLKSAGHTNEGGLTHLLSGQPYWHSVCERFQQYRALGDRHSDLWREEYFARQLTLYLRGAHTLLHPFSRQFRKLRRDLESALAEEQHRQKTQ